MSILEGKQLQSVDVYLSRLLNRNRCRYCDRIGRILHKCEMFSLTFGYEMSLQIYYFQLIPPADMIWNTRQKFQPTKLKLRLYDNWNRGVFTAWGAYPIRYTTTVADFDGVSL